MAGWTVWIRAAPPRRGGLVRQAIAAGAAVLGLAGCTNDSLILPEQRQPAVVTLLAGSGQVGTVGSALATALTVRVSDEAGRPVLGQAVRFSAMPAVGGGHVAPETVATDADGVATAQWVLGPAAGTQTAEATLSTSAPSLAVQFEAVALPAAPDTLFAVSGDGQSGVVGGELNLPLVVRVTDRFGNSISGVAVAWEALGGGSVSAAGTVTDASGEASVRRVLGENPGQQQARATSPGLPGSPVEFTHQAGTGSPAGLLLESGNNQSGVPGEALAAPIVVRLVDGLGNGVPQQAITWPVLGGGGTVLAASSETDATGRASATWVLGPLPGPNILVPSSGGFTAVVTAAGVSSPAAAVAAASPTTLTGQVGSVIAPSPAVRVTNAEGQPVAGVPVVFTVTGGGGNVSSAAPSTDIDGIARAGDWVLGTTVGSNTLSASVSLGNGPLQGSPVLFTASATPGPLHHLAIVTQPSATGLSGRPLARVPVVQLMDEFGNDVAQAGVEVAVRVTDEPAGAAVTPASALTSAEGRATFSGLTLTAPAGSYSLQFSVGPSVAPVTSTQIILSAVVGKVSVVSQPSPTAVNGAALAAQPVVRIEDELGYPMEGVTVEASVASGAGALSGGVTITTGAEGVGAFQGLALTGTVGAYVLQLAAGEQAATTNAIVLTAGPADAARTTASVPRRGDRNQPTVITVQARDQSGNKVLTGGNLIVVTVTGKNPTGPLTATDHGDGTYTASYTPTTKGRDEISITLDGSPISGSPFISDVR